MPSPRRSYIAGTVLLLCLALPAGAQTSTNASAPALKSPTEPAMQVPPDQQAYQSARAVVDQVQRAAALQTFLHDFPESKRADSARHLLFEVLLTLHPQDVPRIHELAQSIVDHAGKDDERRSYAEYDVANYLADALPNGVDLKAAEAWAKDAVALNTLSSWTVNERKSYEKYKLPTPSDAEIRDSWADYKAAYLETLADVYFHEGMLDEASAAADQAQAVKPTGGMAIGTIYLLRGEIAHALHKDDEALDDLELTEVYGGTDTKSQNLLFALYAAKHHGDSSGLDAELDRRYIELQKPFTPTPHTAPASGRTAFIELFTGSACNPCVAADLALDGVLRAYPRSEVVALSFDQHIPDPDPLANADTRARFDWVNGSGTPTAVVDGALVKGVGGISREQGEKSFQSLSKAIDADLSTPSGVTLQLTAALSQANTIVTSATVQVDNPQALKKLLATQSKAAVKASSTDKSDMAVVATPTVDNTKLVMNFALVQKEVRYSGENGIRFHSMVVRSLARPTADGFVVTLSGPSHASFTFDPGAVSDALSKYLAAFAKHDDRFAKVDLLSTDTTLPLDQLAIAAWVEDVVSHKVVAAAYVPIDSIQLKAAR